MQTRRIFGLPSAGRAIELPVLLPDAHGQRLAKPKVFVLVELE